MRSDELIETSLSAAEDWYELHRSQNGNVNTNVMTSGMAVAELLRDQYPLTGASIKSEKNSQVKGLSGALVKKVLARFEETRKFTSEGGRTSRGTIVLATEFAEILSLALQPYRPDENDRARVADALQQYFVERVQRDYFDKKTMEAVLDYNKPISVVVAEILAEARMRADQPTGVVAQHLVGAKLELRFPDVPVGRDKANAADLQTDRQGDFQLGNTAFHVTVAPSAKLVDRARSNLLNGFRPLMLVQSSSLAFAYGLFDSEGLENRVGVQSIESFVGTNIEEMGGFDSDDIRVGLARLIRKYNERIAGCEVDQSLRIHEPAWLIQLLDIKYDVVKIED